MSAENIVNNPPKVFTATCEACGVSEFQLGMRHAEERIIKLLTEVRDNYEPDSSRWFLMQTLIELVEEKND